MIQSTRCKFVCSSIEPQEYSDTSKVKFETRYCPEVPDDERYTKYTPWGEMVVGISNPNALALLEVGKAYYIDVRPVDQLSPDHA